MKPHKQKPREAQVSLNPKTSILHLKFDGRAYMFLAFRITADLISSYKEGFFLMCD
jgi:hypothetical protein